MVDVGLQPQQGLGQAVVGAGLAAHTQPRIGGDAGPQRQRLDAALRQHANLAGAIDGIGGLRGLDHRPRHLAHPQIGLH